MSQKIALIGMPGCGKTKLGKKLHQYLDWDFVDLDHEIELLEKASIRDIFESEGEDAFRAKERNMLETVLADPRPLIIGCGGGTPVFFDNMDLLNEKCITIYLSLPKEALLYRLRTDKSRPLLDDKEDLDNIIADMMIQRETSYAQAHHTITHIPDQWRNLKTLITSLNIML